MSNLSLVEVENNKLDNIEIDKLFEFSFKYNFDLLKQAMESLIYNQKYTNMRLTNIEHLYIFLQEKLEKQDVKVDSLKEQTKHIQNFNVDNEIFKKSMEDLKSHLVQVEKQEIEKIEYNSQKQREELHMNIKNIYRYSYPNKDENERKEIQNKKRFDKLEKQVKVMKKSIKKLKKLKEINKSISLKEEEFLQNQDAKIIKNEKEEDIDSNEKKTDVDVIEKEKSKNTIIDKSEKTKTASDGNTNSKGNEKLLINIFNKSKIGKRFIDFDSSLPDILKLLDDVKIINEILGKKDFNESIKGLINKQNLLEKSMEDLNSKLNDFDIFTLFAGKDKTSGGNEITDVIKGLFQGFEKKYQSKSQTNDDKIKKIEDNLAKSKNDIMIIRMHLEGKAQNTDDPKVLNELKLNFSDLGNSNNEFSNEIEKLYNYINTKFGELNFDPNFPINSKENEEIELNDKNDIVSPNNSDDKISKKVGELEKNFKILYL